MHVQLCMSWKPKESHRSSGTGVTGDYESLWVLGKRIGSSVRSARAVNQ